MERSRPKMAPLAAALILFVIFSSSSPPSSLGAPVEDSEEDPRALTSDPPRWPLPAALPACPPGGGDFQPSLAFEELWAEFAKQNQGKKKQKKVL